MQSKQVYFIEVNVQVEYLQDQSKPKHDCYFFAYTVTIANKGEAAAKLMTRKWRIQDANGKTEEVYGEGVVGEQPHLQPGETYRYTSSAMLETPVGSMAGSYQMIADDGHAFDAPIEPFSLSIPRTLH